MLLSYFLQSCLPLSSALNIHQPVRLSWSVGFAMFAGSASLAHPDWSVLAAVPVEQDMDLSPPGGTPLQSSALSREGALTPEELALLSKSMGPAKRGRPAAEEQPLDQPGPTKDHVVKRPAAVMKRPAAAAAGKDACQKRPAAKKTC